MASQRDRALRLSAGSKGGGCRAAPGVCGGGPPGDDVEKKDASRPTQSFCSVILARKVLPTMPRQPTNPTRISAPDRGCMAKCPE